ncbi:restriction endonuclease [uncultured Muribaculum sp.]|uniref:restriction endonuclease n=1 Tax=uncultured Muribaculum sp. TaxID=1918613 RepID=UPI00259C9EAA|nr:restriction endonuclease [uncultured Muribaculum sp.]
MPNPSVTTNRLHFEDLEPRRFEELGYQLLHRLYKWERLDHTGVCGNDGGIDMYGITKDGVHCYCQVKRYQKLSQSDIKTIYSAIVNNNKDGIEPNSKFILICACDLSKQVLDVAYDEGSKHGFKSVEIISRTKLESLLYNGHRTLLRTFFGIGSKKQESNAAKIRRQARAKKYVINKLMRKDLGKIPYETIAANPDIKFLTDKLMLLSAQSSLAADRYGEDTTHGFAFPIDFKDEGLELSLPLLRKVIFNSKSDTWRFNTEKFPIIGEDEYVLECQEIVILPYYNIVEIEEDGDQYYNYPILHCQTDELMDAFSKITAKHHHLGIVFDEDRELLSSEIALIHAHIKTNGKYLKNG